MDDPSDRNSSVTVAWQWVSRITTISLEMVVPGLAGYFLDQYFGSLPWLTSIGFMLGVAFGMWQLVRMANAAEARDEENKANKPKQRP